MNLYKKIPFEAKIMVFREGRKQRLQTLGWLIVQVFSFAISPHAIKTF